MDTNHITKSLISIFMAIALPLFATGCGGGGGGAAPPAAAPAASPVKSNSGSGKVAATVKLAGRAQARSAEQTAISTVTATLTVTGIYSVDDTEFSPIISTITIDLTQSPVRSREGDYSFGNLRGNHQHRSQ